MVATILCSVVAQVYKFIRLQELGIQKPGEFRPVGVQVLILLRPVCFMDVLVHIKQQAVYRLIEYSIHKTRQFDKEVS